MEQVHQRYEQFRRISVRLGLLLYGMVWYDLWSATFRHLSRALQIFFDDNTAAAGHKEKPIL